MNINEKTELVRLVTIQGHLPTKETLCSKQKLLPRPANYDQEESRLQGSTRFLEK